MHCLRILGTTALITLLVSGGNLGYSQNYGSSSYDTGSSTGDMDFGFGSGSSRRSSRSSRSSTRNSSQRTDSDQSRDQNRRDSTRARNSGQSGSRSTGSKNATPTPAAGAAQKGTTTLKGKAAKGSTGESPARATTNVEFKIKPDPTANLLVVESIGQLPSMNVATAEGERFATRVAFRNGRKSEFQSAEVTLKYDPNVLEPTGIDDAENEALFSGTPLAKVDRRKGIIAYHAEYEQPVSRDGFTVFKIVWRALDTTEYSSIAFLNNEEYPTRLLNHGVNVVQRSNEEGELEVSAGAGLLGADVSVGPSEATQKRLEEEGEEFSGMTLANSISQGTAAGGVTLSLRPRTTNPSVGDTFLVDIVYSNPRRTDIDTVKLQVQFDPKVLQVVDYDDDNWITRDVNIFDGEYHDDLPFDFHRKNVAYNATGEIHYWMGFSSKVRVPSSGVIATVKFKAVAPAASTEVAFDLQEDQREHRTAVSFLGFNLIGTPGERLNALRSASVSVN